MWTKLDDGFYDHPKISDAIAKGGLEAVGLHALALSYCGRHNTGGEILRAVPFVQGRARLVKSLVRVGLWEETSSGWRIHDWGDYNPTAEEARRYQARMQEVRRLGGSVRAATASRTAGRFAPATASNAAGGQHQPRTRTRPVPKMNKTTPAGQVVHTNGSRPNGQGQNQLFADEMLDRIIPRMESISDTKRARLHQQFASAPEGAVVRAVEDCERAFARGGIKDQVAYLISVLDRHASYRASVQEEQKP